MTAMQGRIGIDLARQHSPDLILLDLHLPDIPGWEVLKELKSQAATCDRPIVVISADATRQQINRLMKEGATSYLTKPIDVDRFCQIIGRTTGLSATTAITSAISPTCS
jgi:CheY-like chemotaxis protein